MIGLAFARYYRIGWEVGENGGKSVDGEVTLITILKSTIFVYRYQHMAHIPSEFILPVEFDVLVAATNVCLRGYAPGWVEYDDPKIMPGSATWRISQNELGSLGDITIRKLPRGESQVDCERVPNPTEEDALAFVTTYRRQEFSAEQLRMLESYLSQKRTSNQKGEKVFHMKSVHGFEVLSSLEAKSWTEYLWNTSSSARKELEEQRAIHKGNILNAYFNRLLHQDIWPRTQTEILAHEKIVSETAASLEQPPYSFHRNEAGATIQYSFYSNGVRLGTYFIYPTGHARTKEEAIRAIDEDLQRVLLLGNVKLKERAREFCAIWRKIEDNYWKQTEPKNPLRGEGLTNIIHNSIYLAPGAYAEQVAAGTNITQTREIPNDKPPD